MTASQIVSRARSLADFPNAQFISYQDQLKSVKDAYRDVYEFLIQNDDDYFLNETTTTLTTANLSPTQVDGAEWWVPLPADFKSIRYLDYQAQGIWTPIYKFAMSQRGQRPSDVMYRIRNGNLWIVGGLYIGAGTTIRIGYYPVEASITLPDADLVFGTSWGNLNIANVTYPTYAPAATGYRTLFYVYNGNTVYEESQDNQTVAAPFLAGATLGATATFMNYYKGELYWISSGNIMNANATLTSGQTAATFTAATLTVSGSITSVGVFNNVLYFTDSSNLKTASIGTGAVLGTLAAVAGATYPCFTQQWSDTFYIRGGSVQGVSTATLTLGYSVIQLQTDGTNLFALDSSYNLHRVASSTLTNATFGVAFTDSIIRTDVLSVGPWSQASQRQIASTIPWVEGFLPVFTREKQELLVISDQVDYSFTYPNDLMTQTMEYQVAVDFKVKQDPDSSSFTQSGLLKRLGKREPPSTGLWLTLLQSIKRDDHMPTRINHRYASPWGIW